MLIALMSDIHANREAFSACLAHAASYPVDRYVFLGDYVGYGADPGWAVDTVMDHVERGAIALLGNHDEAISAARVQMNEVALAAIEWTRTRLDARQREFLSRLPLTMEEADRLYVHASAQTPAAWHYVTDVHEARQSSSMPLRGARHSAATSMCPSFTISALRARSAPSRRSPASAFRCCAGAAGSP